MFSIPEEILPILFLLLIGFGFYRGFKGFSHNIRQTKGRDMLLIFDALYEIIKDTEDSELQTTYSDLIKKYRDDEGEFMNTDSNTLFMLKRDARKIFLDIKRKYPDLKTIVDIKQDGEIVLDTGVRI